MNAKELYFWLQPLVAQGHGNAKVIMEPTLEEVITAKFYLTSDEEREIYLVNK